MRPAQNIHRQSTHAGFTLMELMVVIAIAAILSGLAVPSFRAALDNGQMREAATSFYSALGRARSEAIARNQPVRVCARNPAAFNPPACSDGGDWADGWIVETTRGGIEQLQVHEPLARGFTLDNVGSAISFDASGRIAAGTEFQLCKPDSTAAQRLIRVSRSGAVSLETLEATGACPG